MMRVVVCVRQGLDGELNPFDASAYEAALTLPDCEVILLSMGAPKTRDMLMSLTRLGAARAVLLSDSAFAGADTLATAYALSLAIKRLAPELVICGRQTLVGDTAQTGPMLSELIGYELTTEVMSLMSNDGEIQVALRKEEKKKINTPALITVERSYNLRFPRLGSKMREVEVWSAADVSADVKKCGLAGSPTRVLKTFENEHGRRKCKFISPEELEGIIAESLAKSKEKLTKTANSGAEKLELVLAFGEGVSSYAEELCDSILKLPLGSAEDVIAAIKKHSPDAVLFASDAESKRISATVCARLGLGLCADCTALDCEGGELIMYRPALSGSLIAKIKSLTRPAAATVRTESPDVPDIIVGAGYGVRDKLAELRAYADSLGAGFAVTRKLVDNGYAPYHEQVGLTGRTVSPAVYIAVGISGAVHHIAGIDRSGTVIAINPDKDAPIFDYADFAVVSGQW